MTFAKGLAFCVASLISLGLGGCAVQPPISPPPTAAASPLPTPSQTPSRTPSGVPLTNDQQKGIKPPADFFDDPSVRVFDLAEVAPYFYYCDPCTVDSIVEKFGTPQKMFGQWEEAGNAWIEIDYTEMKIYIGGSLEGLSFSGQYPAGPESEFPLTVKDRTQPLLMLSVETTDPAAAIPRGLAIGRSPRAQVKAAYPADSADFDSNNSGVNEVNYVYIWFKDKEAIFKEGAESTGGLSYTFGANDVLSSVTVIWLALGD